MPENHFSKKIEIISEGEGFFGREVIRLVTFSIVRSGKNDLIGPCRLRKEVGEGHRLVMIYEQTDF